MSVTIIDFTVQKSKIANYRGLPEKVQKLIDRAERIEVHGFQYLNGYIGRKLIWCAGGYWTSDSPNASFIVQSIGGWMAEWRVQWSENEEA